MRRLDHLNLLASNVTELRVFFEDVLGMRTTEKIVLDSGEEAGVWVTATNKTYDVAFTHDHYGAHGRFHHVTYALDSREEVLRAADIFLENGIHIETGPHKHAVQQTFFLYVYEPGGNRVEVANAGARLMLAPDWQPIVWTETERKKGQAWGLKTIESFHTHGTPPIRPVHRADQEIVLRVISSMATRHLLTEIGSAFAAASPGAEVSVVSMGGVDAAKRVAAGEPCDVVVLASVALERSITQGHVLAGSRVDVVNSSMAVAIRTGERRPSIDTEDAVRRTGTCPRGTSAIRPAPAAITCSPCSSGGASPTS